MIQAFTHLTGKACVHTSVLFCIVQTEGSDSDSFICPTRGKFTVQQQQQKNSNRNRKYILKIECIDCIIIKDKWIISILYTCT